MMSEDYILGEYQTDDELASIMQDKEIEISEDDITDDSEDIDDTHNVSTSTSPDFSPNPMYAIYPNITQGNKQTLPLREFETKSEMLTYMSENGLKL